MDPDSRDEIIAILDRMAGRDMSPVAGTGDGMPLALIDGPLVCFDHLGIQVVVMAADARLHDPFFMPAARPGFPVLYDDGMRVDRTVKYVRETFEESLTDTLRHMESVCAKVELKPQHEEKGFYRRFEKRRPGGGYAKGKRKR